VKALITGGAGFIGSHLADRLLEEGMKVCIIDNLSSGSENLVNSRAMLFVEDIGNYASLKEIFKKIKPELVFHLAAQIDVAASFEKPEVDFNVNVLGTFNVLRAAAEAGAKKVIFSSSAAVYGEPLYLPVDESHPLKPLAPYGVSKAAAEWYLRLLAEKAGLEVTILRLSNVYGPRQGLKKPSGIVSILITSFLQGKRAVLYSPRTMTRDYIYVGDVVEAMVLAASKAGNEVLNISSCKETTTMEIYRLICKEIQGSFVEEPYRSGEIKRIFLSNSRARKVLGWEPKTSLEEGIKQTVSFFKKWMGGL